MKGIRSHAWCGVPADSSFWFHLSRLQVDADIWSIHACWSTLGHFSMHAGPIRIDPSTRDWEARCARDCWRIASMTHREFGLRVAGCFARRDSWLQTGAALITQRMRFACFRGRTTRSLAGVWRQRMIAGGKARSSGLGE